MKAWLRCIGCGATRPLGADLVCPSCGDLLEIQYDFVGVDAAQIFRPDRRLGVWKYRRLLPFSEGVRPITLDEGGTRLVRLQNLERTLSMESLYAKNEGDNPTGSFKDRGMTVGVTRAVEVGARAVVCASTGNTAASMAAYAARAGLSAYVVVPSGGVAKGKLLQSLVYGAKVVETTKSFDEAIRSVFGLLSMSGLYPLNSLNPYRLEGQKTLAYEIYEQTAPELPDTVFIPVGNGGNISALAKGFMELVALGLVERAPRIVGVQAEGASPIVEAFEAGLQNIRPKQNPTTYASAIRIGNPVRWKQALAAIRQTRGVAVAVSDDDIRRAQRLLARSEGIFVEPASAASLAGLIKLLEQGKIGRSERALCVLTGNGLKDPDAASLIASEPTRADGDLEQLLGKA